MSRKVFWRKNLRFLFPLPRLIVLFQTTPLRNSSQSQNLLRSPPLFSTTFFLHYSPSFSFLFSILRILTLFLFFYFNYLQIIILETLLQH